MGNDVELEKTKTLDEVDQGKLREEDTHEVNGARVLEKDEGRAGSSTGGGGGGGGDDDVDVNTPLKELSPRKSRGDRKAGGTDGSEVEERSQGKESGENGEIGRVGAENGVDGYGAENGDRSGDNATLVSNSGGDGKGLKSAVRRSLRLKSEGGDGSGLKVKGDPDEKVADFLSAVSQRTRNRVVRGKKEEIEDIGGAQNETEMDGEGEYESGFSVGDFVWGKIKSHPWWPGRIFSPSDASQFALNYKHEGRLLVAYFGDGTFAWCDPSQLKHFDENFEETSKQGSSKSFVNAVEEALEELGRLVELQTARKENKRPLPLVVNAGIKEGVHVPLGGIEKFSFVQFEPTKILADIRSFARFVSVPSMLEVSVLKSQLSSFYGGLLPVYYEPLGIEDIVDKHDSLREGLVQAPDDEDWSVMQTGPETSDKSRKRRKEKSIAELLAMEEKVGLADNHVDGTEGEMQSGEVASKSGKRKRKVADDETDISKKEGQSASTSKSSRKRTKIVDGNQSHAAEREKRKGKMDVSVKVDNGVLEEEVHERVSPRERKKSKYLSPPYTNQLQKQRNSRSQIGSDSGSLEFSDVARVGERMSKAAGKIMGSPPMMKCSAETFQESSSKGVSSGNGKVGGQDPQPAQANLSPDDAMKNGVESSNEVLCEVRSSALDPMRSRKDQSSDTIKGFLSSYRSANYKNGSNYNSFNEQMDGQSKSKRNSEDTKHGSDRDAPNQVDESKLKTPGRRGRKKKEHKADSNVEQVLPSDSKKTDNQSKRKRYSADAKHGSDGDALNQVDEQNSKLKTPGRRGRKKKEHSSDPNVEQESPSDSKKTDHQSKRKRNAADTKHGSDGEALNQVEEQKKLKTLGRSGRKKKEQRSDSNVEQEMPSALKKADAQKKKKSKSSEKQQIPPGAVENEPLAVVFIKQKLESMTSMLAQTDGKMTDEIKSNLETEVQELLKKVKLMTASSS